MPVFNDKTTWSPEEQALKKAVQTLFKNNYGRDEIKYLLDKSLFALCLCDWKISDIEAMQMLEMCKMNYTKVRDSFCFTRVVYGKKTENEERTSSYYRKKIIPQREILRKQMELQKIRDNLAAQEKVEEPDESLCAEQRV